MSDRHCVAIDAAGRGASGPGDRPDHRSSGLGSRARPPGIRAMDVVDGAARAADRSLPPGGPSAQGRRLLPLGELLPSRAPHAPRPGSAFTLAVLCAALVGCAVPVPLRETSAAGTVVVGTLDLDARPVAAHWYLPPTGEAPALVVFEHGFARRCANLRETTRQVMAAGLMALCVDVPMAGGNPALAETLARHLARDAQTPDGRAVPRRVVVAGHSAGAVFALALGARLEALAPGRLAGALLVDPVAPPVAEASANPGEPADPPGASAPGASAASGGPTRFEATLHAVSAGGRRPVLALLAPRHRCNAASNALPALRRAEQAAREAGSHAFVVVQFGEGATHADVEGEDTDALATWACGTVDPARSAALRVMAIDWLRGVARTGP